MSIVVHLDVMLAKRRKSSRDLAAFVGITEQNISTLKNGRVRGIRFSTLEKICEFLDCQPGDLLTFEASDTSEADDRR
jgi:putative transcriptional regulator